MALLILYLSWPVFVNAYNQNEVSTNAGGLIIWPARLLLLGRALPKAWRDWTRCTSVVA